VFRTGFFDESDLSQVRLGESRRFPPWQLRTGSAVLDGSEGGNRVGGPRAVTPPSRKHLRHMGNLVRQPLSVCCRHAGKRSDGSGLASDRSNPSRNHVGSLPSRAIGSSDVDQPRLRRVIDLLIMESGENTSGTRETMADNYFLFAATT